MARNTHFGCGYLRSMCLTVLAYRVHPRYPLIVGANRDEFRMRPTAPAHFWNNAPEVLAGRDLQAGGPWPGLAIGVNLN